MRPKARAGEAWVRRQGGSEARGGENLMKQSSFAGSQASRPEPTRESGSGSMDRRESPGTRKCESGSRLTRPPPAPHLPAREIAAKRHQGQRGAAFGSGIPQSDLERFGCLVCLTGTVYHPLRVGDKLSFISITL